MPKNRQNITGKECLPVANSIPVIMHREKLKLRLMLDTKHEFFLFKNKR